MVRKAFSGGIEISRHRGICQIEGCPNLQMYSIYKTFPDGTKKWLRVCQRHDKLIGSENLQRARGQDSGGVHELPPRQVYDRAF